MKEARAEMSLACLSTKLNNMQYINRDYSENRKRNGENDDNDNPGGNRGGNPGGNQNK